MVVTWTLVIYLTVGGPSIVIDGFANEDDCLLLGQMYQEMINEKAKFQCNKIVVRT